MSPSTRLQLFRRLLHLVEAEPFVGIEVEHHPVGLFDVATDAAQPWNSIVPICTQVSMPVGVVDVEIVLRPARPSP